MDTFKSLKDSGVSLSSPYELHHSVSANSRASKSRTGLMRRLFLRSDLKTSNVECKVDVVYGRSDLTIGPSPAVRPLGQKMIARSENNVCLPRLSVARAREVAVSEPGATRLALSTSTNEFPRLLQAEDGRSVHEYPDYWELQILRARETVAWNAALNQYRIGEWRTYLKSYTEGRFNLCCPPVPPLRTSSFGFLPAIYPADEADRLGAILRYNQIWSARLVERASKLCTEAMAQFGVSGAAISVFDRYHEVFIAEKGYNREHVMRWDSIAGHVLLSSNVMTILDTRKDWRFARNPHVIGDPEIRFFAGAPMLTSDGKIAGVVSIFAKQACKAFPIEQERALVNFATMAMCDLMPPSPNTMNGTFTDIQNTLATAQSNIKDANEADAVTIDRASCSSISTLSTDILEENLISAGLVAEALFAAELWARLLGLDAIYAVQVEPSRDFMTAEELREPGAISLRLVVNYGLEDGVAFDPHYHLQALRSECLYWQVEDAKLVAGGQIGRVITLPMSRHAQPWQTRGLVFGAFKKVGADGKLPEHTSEDIVKEATKLRECADILLKILVKRCQALPAKRADTEPSSPTTYVDPDAIHASKRSLDAGERMAKRAVQAELQCLPF